MSSFPLRDITNEQQTQSEAFNQRQKILTISSIADQWNDFSQEYNKTDMSVQTFYYSFLSLMKMNEANRILQVGSGNGKLLPVAVMLKRQSATYLATDLAENMIERAKHNLRENFQKYDSRLTFDQWCLKQNLAFKTVNGEEVIQKNVSFDRIICNCVLMITEDPEKMLRNLYDQAASGCLLGVSVWGDREKNQYLNFVCKLSIQGENQSASYREQFHLYKKVRSLAQRVGWKTHLQWEQNSLMPILNMVSDYDKTLGFFASQLPACKREQVLKEIRLKGSQLLNNKKGLNFSAQLYLFQKP